MKYAVLLSLMILAVPAFAQALDKAILVTDMTSVDALIAKAAGERNGMPVLIAEDGLLTGDVKSELASLNARTVILVGGPQVIKPEVQAELERSAFTVLRLWGIERTGTAIEVAKYFWPDGAECAVLADDTKNSDDDTELQVPASSLATEKGCPLIPVPKGAMPADVLSLLDELNPSEVKFVAKTTPDTAQLAKFKIKAIVGGKKEIELEVENEIEAEAVREGKKLKMVIVAASAWRNGLGIVAHPSERSVVRFVSNVSEVAELIAKIKEKNITDVRVVGQPALAQEIATALTNAGITPKVVSGEKAAKVAKDILEELKEKWKEKKKIFEDRHNKVKVKIKEKLLERLNEIENGLGEHEIEIEDLKADGADAAKAAEIQKKIDDAKSRLANIRSLILDLDVDNANRQLTELLSGVREKKWMFRDEIKLRVLEKLTDEEEDNSGRQKDVQDKVVELEGKSARLKERCGDTAAVEELVTKAKTALDDKSFAEAKRLINSAKRMGNVCEKVQKIEGKLQKTAEKRAEKAKKVLEKATMVKTSSPVASPAAAATSSP